MSVLKASQVQVKFLIGLLDSTNISKNIFCFQIHHFSLLQHFYNFRGNTDTYCEQFMNSDSTCVSNGGQRYAATSLLQESPACSGRSLFSLLLLLLFPPKELLALGTLIYSFLRTPAFTHLYSSLYFTANLKSYGYVTFYNFIARHSSSQNFIYDLPHSKVAFRKCTTKNIEYDTFKKKNKDQG